MPIEEWLIRIGGAIFLVNIFTMGMYFILRGYYKHKRLSKMHKLDGRVGHIDKFFRASVTWYWRGQEVVAIQPSLFALRRNTIVPLYLNDTGTDFNLNIWTHNGKGLIGVGVILCLSALALTIVLI